jgi:hypothetical protein
VITDNLSFDIAAGVRALQDIAVVLRQIAEPRTITPGEGIYQEALTALMALVGRDVVVRCRAGDFALLVTNGALSVSPCDDLGGPLGTDRVTRFELTHDGDRVGEFLVERDAVTCVHPSVCGCVELHTIGGEVRIVADDCDHHGDDDG